jgi:biopolymer transport protein ExbD
MLFRKNTEDTEKSMHEINMTPLIDVSLVLVVMLLLATPLAFESSIAVRKSHASTQAAEKTEKNERIELRIISEEQVRVNRMLVQREELRESLKPLLEKSSKRQVVIRCADDVSHGVFVDVLDQVKLCGALDIGFAGR